MFEKLALEKQLNSQTTFEQFLFYVLSTVPITLTISEALDIINALLYVNFFSPEPARLDREMLKDAILLPEQLFDVFFASALKLGILNTNQASKDYYISAEMKIALASILRSSTRAI